MSVVDRSVTIQCDGRNGTFACERYMSGDTASEARAVAAEAGWVCRGSARDYCPEHTEGEGE